MSSAVRAALALAAGRPVEDFSFAWPCAFAVAKRERCAPLAWLRSGATIRRLAPAQITLKWRAEAIASADLASAWEHVLSEVIVILHGVTVAPMVLKGLPLAERLYGTPAARPTSDLDLYIPFEDRAAAHVTLVAAGWRWLGGEAPSEGRYEAVNDARAMRIEIHSSLLDDGLVRHLKFATPLGRLAKVGATEAFVHDDRQLPSFLAVHLAKHSLPPMLWALDFAALWTRLSEIERSDAWSAARGANAARYLAWAVRRAEHLAAAIDGDDIALRALGFHNGRRRDVHNAIRTAVLASSPKDAARVIAAWLFPRSPGGTRWEALFAFGGRVATRLPRILGRQRAYSSSLRQPTAGKPERHRVLALESSDFAVMARDLVGRDVSFWVRASGSSMEPSIPNGSEVRLQPINGRELRIDDVVLADLGVRGFVIHRIRGFDTSFVRLRGDANVRSDPPVTREQALAIVDAIRVPGRRGTGGSPAIGTPRKLLAMIGASRRAWRRIARGGPGPRHEQNA